MNHTPTTEREDERMDLFGKKAKMRIEELEEYIEGLRTQHDYIIGDNMRAQYDHEVEVAALRTKNEILGEKHEFLKNEVEALKKLVQSDEAYVKLSFAEDNYQMVTPHIAITDGAFEELFAIRAIDDSQSDNDNAIRLALLNLAREALEQICDDFSGEFE